MTQQSVEDLLAEILQVPSSMFTDDLPIRELPSWDSLKHMEMVAALERTFEREFTFDQIVSFRTVGEIKRVLNETAH